MHCLHSSCNSAPTNPPAQTTNPACPGVVKNRPDMLLSQLAPENDLLQCISQIQSNAYLTPKKAFLQLIKYYDVPLDVAIQHW